MKSSELANVVESTLRDQYEHMETKEWAEITDDELEMIIDLCRAGIMGPGKEQYERNGRQKFEDMTLDGLVDYIKEEARDLINYGVMTLWRLGQVSLALKVLGDQGEIQKAESLSLIAPIDSFDSPESTMQLSDQHQS